jgi:hypothetical protein
VELDVIAIARPETGEYNAGFQRYVDRAIDEDDILDALERQVDDVHKAFEAFAPARESYRYAPEKWTVRQVLGHVIDTERMFGYRALALGRGETQNLPGFDEDVYAAAAPHQASTLASLLVQFGLVRRSQLLMLREFDDAAWAREGKANGNRITVRALPFIMLGHVRHHLAVLQDKYAG